MPQVAALNGTARRSAFPLTGAGALPLARLQDLAVDRASSGHDRPLEAGAAAELWQLPSSLPPAPSDAGY